MLGRWYGLLLMGTPEIEGGKPYSLSRPVSAVGTEHQPLISVTVRFSSLSEIVASMTGGVAMETVSPLAGM